MINPEILVTFKVRIALRRNPGLPAGVWISVFHLEFQNTQHLAPGHMRDARRDRGHDGNVSFLARYDCPQLGGVRDGCVARKARKTRFAA